MWNLLIARFSGGALSRSRFFRDHGASLQQLDESLRQIYRFSTKPRQKQASFWILRSDNSSVFLQRIINFFFIKCRENELSRETWISDERIKNTGYSCTLIKDLIKHRQVHLEKPCMSTKWLFFDVTSIFMAKYRWKTWINHTGENTYKCRHCEYQLLEHIFALSFSCSRSSAFKILYRRKFLQM